jgi:DNA-binding MarR family transcriptional regulator
MSRPRPVTGGAPRPTNTVVLLREAYLTLNDLAIVRLAERGHEAVRPAHGAVFQYLDDTGTTVSTLAARAEMTKQAMAELVAYLERQGYVVRVPDPTDRRARLVRPTAAGREVVAIAQELVPEVEHHIDDVLGPDRARALRRDLAILQRLVPGRTAAGTGATPAGSAGVAP